MRWVGPRFPHDTPATIDAFQTSGWEHILTATAGYDTLWNAFSTAARAALAADRVAHAKVLWLLADACSLRLRPGHAQEVLRPQISTPTARSAGVDDFTESDVHFFAQVCEHIANPLLRARVADLVWQRAKPRQPRYALLAIDAYRNVPLDIDMWLHDGRSCWERAIGLCRMLGKGAGDRRTLLEQALLTTFTQLGGQEGFRALWIAEVLLTHGLAQEPTTDVPEHLERIAAHFESQQQWHHARLYLSSAIDWFTHRRDLARAHEMTVRLAQAWTAEGEQRQTAGPPGSAVAADCFEHAIHMYRKIPHADRDALGIPARIDHLRRALQNAGTQTLKAMGRLATHIDVTDLVRQAQDRVRGQSTMNALLALANLYPGVCVSDLRAQTLASLDTFMLRRLFGATHLASDGRVVSRRAPIDLRDQTSDVCREALRGEMISDYTKGVDLIVRAVLWPALTVVIAEHEIREADCVLLAQQSRIAPPSRERLLGKALFHGFEADFTSALHLIIPQLEHIIRWHLKAADELTTTLDTDGIEQEKSLNALLDLPATTSIFGEDLVFEFAALLCEPVGLNLRNDLAHGLLSDGASETSAAVYVWWRAFKLIITSGQV